MNKSKQIVKIVRDLQNANNKMQTALKKIAIVSNDAEVVGIINKVFDELLGGKQ